MLLPKEELPLIELKNWPPITLLNVDYKIASKAIARRIEPTLPHLIHADQTGFIKGRYIGENIRLINDLMEQTNATKIPGILLALDFRNAFDTLEWTLIQYVLQKFNFGEGIRRWVEIFYNDVENTILLLPTGLNLPEELGKVVPFLPLLFVLSAEVLANKIRQSHLIKGVSLVGNEIKLSQFDDDTNLVCSDLLSVEKALQILDDFGDISGLRLNKEKTQAMWLGPRANKKVKPLGL